MVAAIPSPWLPYAKRHIGKPIFPVLGNINGGSSVTISLFKNLRKITPVRANPAITNNEYQCGRFSGNPAVRPDWVCAVWEPVNKNK